MKYLQFSAQEKLRDIQISTGVYNLKKLSFSVVQAS